MAKAIASSVRLYQLDFSSMRTWLMAALFVIGNIALPQLCHLVPQGGLVFLPIYFFTLIGAYKYGWKVGLLTAVLSPVINCALFGMPAMASLPAIEMKGILLALAASYAAARFSRVNLLILLGVVLSYQVVGCAIEGLYHSSFAAGIQDFRLGIPGMLLQVVGGYVVLRYLLKK